MGSTNSSTGLKTLAPLWAVHHGGVQVEQVRAGTALAARRIVSRKRGLPFETIGAIQAGPKVVLFSRPQPAGPGAGDAGQ